MRLSISMLLVLICTFFAAGQWNDARVGDGEDQVLWLSPRTVYKDVSDCQNNKNIVETVTENDSSYSIKLREGQHPSWVGGDNCINLSSELTISVWLYLSSIPSEQQWLFFKQDAFYVIIDPNDGLVFGIPDQGEEGVHTPLSSPFGTNRWVHIAFTYNESYKDAKIYIGGSSKSVVDNDDGGPNALNASISKLYIGGRLNENFGQSGERYYRGMIDAKITNIQIYTRALTKDEIEFLADLNYPPEITSDAVTTATENEDYVYSVTAEDINAVTISLEEGPEGMTMKSDVISWTPADSQVGVYDVSVKAVDDLGESSTQDFSITVKGVDDPPEFVTTPEDLEDQVVEQGEIYECQLEVDHPDEDDKLTYTVYAGPDDMDVSSQGKVLWVTTDAKGGEHDVIIKVEDTNENSDMLAFKVYVEATVVEPPEVSVDVPRELKTDSLYMLPVTTKSASGEDVQLKMVDSPEGMKMLDDNLVYQPKADANKKDTVIIVVSYGDSKDTIVIPIKVDKSAPVIYTRSVLTSEAVVDYDAFTLTGRKYRMDARQYRGVCLLRSVDQNADVRKRLYIR